MKKSAQMRINDAAKGCDRVHDAMRRAVKTLAASITVNGYGIYRDRCEVQQTLADARADIDAALQLVSHIEWPTDADYDAAN